MQFFFCFIVFLLLPLIVRNWGHFYSYFPHQQTIQLNMNHRSTQNIIDACYALISHNRVSGTGAAVDQQTPPIIPEDDTSRSTSTSSDSNSSNSNDSNRGSSNTSDKMTATTATPSTVTAIPPLSSPSPSVPAVDWSQRLGDKIFSSKLAHAGSGKSVHLVRCENQQDEAIFVTNMINIMVNQRKATGTMRHGRLLQ